MTMTTKDPLPPPIWTTGTTEVFKTGTWRAALPEHRRTPSPCGNACPVHGNIAVWIQHAKAQRYRDAWLSLMDNNPFPAVSGRICHHPCEAACNRGEFDEAINISRLERFVGDMAIQQGWTYPKNQESRKERVAIVGSGPSGLSAAFQLRRRGYGVTIFESQALLGGLMRHGIPEYRLPKAVLDSEVQRILDLGVDVRTGRKIDSAEEFQNLIDEFDAVYLAMGASRPKRLPTLDYAQSWVIDGAEYLARTNSGAVPRSGQRLIVIGGGSAALDVARTARRHGNQVQLLALEPEAVMPAQRDEVVDAKEEGIVLLDGAMLQSVSLGSDGLVLSCIKVAFSRGAAAGQFKIDPIAGSEFSVAADAVVSSIGQDPDLDALSGLVESNGSVIRVDGEQKTTHAKLFAGGDVASMARFVTQAIGFGKQAAGAIERALHPKTGDAGAKLAGEVGIEAINTYYYGHEPRSQENHVPATERVQNFHETALGLELGTALAETDRCFSCGNCIFCDNCFYYCPDMAVEKVEGGYRIKTDYCKGCGLCAKECPTGSILMREEQR
jgi:NADPH-dependent glutamate synthase beta subunit-like oxidoreductase